MMAGRKFILTLIMLFAVISAKAQVDLEAEFFSLPENVTPEYLDSVTVQKMSPTTTGRQAYSAASP